MEIIFLERNHFKKIPGQIGCIQIGHSLRFVGGFREDFLKTFSFPNSGTLLAEFLKLKNARIFTKGNFRRGLNL